MALGLSLQEGCGEAPGSSRPPSGGQMPRRSSAGLCQVALSIDSSYHAAGFFPASRKVSAGFRTRNIVMGLAHHPLPCPVGEKLGAGPLPLRGEHHTRARFTEGPLRVGSPQHWDIAENL